MLFFGKYSDKSAASKIDYVCCTFKIVDKHKVLPKQLLTFSFLFLLNVLQDFIHSFESDIFKFFLFVRCIDLRLLVILDRGLNR